MNETEIRSRVHGAIGESDYPPALTQSVHARLNKPADPGPSRLLGVVAALLAIVIVVTLLYVRAHTQPTVPATSPVPTSRPTPSTPIPASVLTQTMLSTATAVLAYPNQEATSGTRTMKIVAAYADPLYTAVIFEAPGPNLVLTVSVFDDTAGVANVDLDGYPSGVDTATDGWGSALRWHGAHAGRNGMVRLRVAMTGEEESDRTASPARLNRYRWDFAFDVKLQAAAKLPLKPALTSVGSWTFRDVAFELTPSIVYFHALVTGASMVDPGAIDVRLEDANSHRMNGAGSYHLVDLTTGEINANLYWERPPNKSSNQLRIVNGDVTYVTDVAIPASPTA